MLHPNAGQACLHVHELNVHGGSLHNLCGVCLLLKLHSIIIQVQNKLILHSCVANFNAEELHN